MKDFNQGNNRFLFVCFIFPTGGKQITFGNKLLQAKDLNWIQMNLLPREMANLKELYSLFQENTGRT